jgi:hypothetical protein
MRRKGESGEISVKVLESGEMSVNESGECGEWM